METTPNAFDLGAILASLIVYLGYLAGLATACQAAINKAKPVLLEPIRTLFKLDENGWLILMYIAQFVFAVIGFATLGWAATLSSALAPVLAVLPIPDTGILVFSILLVVAGQEIIYGLIKGIQGFQDSIAELPTPVVNAQAGSNVDVNVERAAPKVQPDFYKDKR
jgi:hypothetical protein